MPFKSLSMLRALFAKAPDVANRWKDKYGIPKNLPEHVAKPKKKKELKK